MAGHHRHQHIEVRDGGRTVAGAEVIISEESGGTVWTSLHAESGHIPPGRRASLVDAVLDLPEVRESARLEAALPLGDTESLHRLQQRCEHVRTRPAGSSAIVEADLPSAGEPAATSDAADEWPAYRALPGGRRNPAVHPAAHVDSHDGTAAVTGKEAA